jgi:response regulator RpfG family c-di-GMP phosphodiesterase
MNERVLLIDDDELLLNSYQRSLRQFSLDMTTGGPEALDKLKSGVQYAVILSDLRMPGMSGLEVLRRARELCPDTVGMILTGNADLRTAIDAVNDGNIFRFLEKPCASDALVAVLTAAISQYRLVVAEKDLLQNTLRGTVQVLTQVLEVVDPEASSTGSRVNKYVGHIVESFGINNAWQFEVAAMLSQLGSSVLSQNAKGVAQNEFAHDLLRKIPRLEVIASMIRRQQESFHSEAKVPIKERSPEILGAQILRVCVRFDALVRSGNRFAQALDKLLAEPAEYDSLLVGSLRELPREDLPFEPRTVSVKDLALRMVLNEEVRTTNGALLVRDGVEITDMLLARLRSFHDRKAIPDSLKVLVPLSVR